MRKLSVRMRPPGTGNSPPVEMLERMSPRALNTLVMPIGLFTTPANVMSGEAWSDVVVFWIVIGVGLKS